MGACPSGKYFHEVIKQIIRDVPRCENISDNIWLWSENIDEHIKQLDQLLETLQNNGITLKLPKCSFGVREINVFGHIVSGQGIRPDDKKIEAVTNAPRPKCASEVRSFLRLTNYCSRYVLDYSNVNSLLRQLTKTTSSFHWGKEQGGSFIRLKQALASPQVLAHYSLTAPSRLVVDTSSWALGAVLLQQQADSTHRPIAYGSRSLTEVEMEYPQFEKELLQLYLAANTSTNICTEDTSS